MSNLQEHEAEQAAITALTGNSMTESSKWMESLSVQVQSDAYVTSKHGFLLWQLDMDADGALFESGFVYSTREDAQQAGDDAAFAAWKFRNL